MAFILFLTAILLLRAMLPLFDVRKPPNSCLGSGLSSTLVATQSVYCAILHTVTKQQMG